MQKYYIRSIMDLLLLQTLLFSIYNSMPSAAKKVVFQAHPLRHPNAPEIQPSPVHATARSQG